MVLDVLDCLEWYRSLHPQMQQVIDILDRSEVYDQTKGTYVVEELVYSIETYLTSAEGVVRKAKQDQLQVILEGEELFSLQVEDKPEMVFPLTTGMFVFVRSEEVYRHRQELNGIKAVKKVVFTLDQPVS